MNPVQELDVVVWCETSNVAFLCNQSMELAIFGWGQLWRCVGEWLGNRCRENA